MAEGAHSIQHVTLRDLTPRQRRELGGIMAAGLASAAFFAIPFVQILEPAPLSSVPTALQMSVVAESPRGFAVPLPPRSLTVAPAGQHSAPRLRARRSNAVMALAGAASFASPEPQANTSRAPRRITRLLFGSGRYRVQPFPMPTEQ